MTASCACLPELRTYSRYVNFATFSLISLSIITSLSTSVLPVKPQHFLPTKSINLVKYYLIPKHLLCTQQLQLMHKIKFFFTLLLHTEHGNLEASIATVLSPAKKPLLFTVEPFFVIAFCTVCIFSIFQLSPSSTKSLANRSSFTLLSLYIFRNSSITSQIKKVKN